MVSKFLTATALLTGVLLGAVGMPAQDIDGAPKPAAAVGDTSAVLQPNGPQDTPDARPLSGAQNLSLGSQSGSHSFLLPSFGITTAVQTNPYNSNQTNAPSFVSTTYLSGRVGINKISGHSELLVDYLASGGFSSYANQGSSLIQGLDFAETIRWGRWSQMFGDHLTYLPGSSFDFGGLGGLNNLGVNLGSVGSTPAFRQDIVSGQNIITTGAPVVSNTAIAQTTYALGYRSSLTFVAAYSTVHFLDGGFQDSGTASFRGGYNYLLSPKNSMSVSYGFSRLLLSNSPLRIDDHNVQLSFARRITGRLALQVGAGPDILIFRAPLAGPSTVVNWAVYGGLVGTYQFRHLEVGFNYSHSLTAGSGVLPGAQTDVVSATLGRNFGHWNASIMGGYSRNRAFQQTLLNANAITPQGWFTGALVSRRFTSYGGMYISYNASGQSNLSSICLLPACRAGALTQTVAIGYNWGLRPIVLE